MAVASILEILKETGSSVNNLYLDDSAPGIQMGQALLKIEVNSPSAVAQKSVLETITSTLNLSPETDTPPSVLDDDFNQTVIRLSDPNSIEIPEEIPADTGFRLPDFPVLEIKPEEFEAAEKRLAAAGLIVDTPVYRSARYSRECGCDVVLMLDNLQVTGSFKQRGSGNALL
ncbi:hypothetical protein KIPB_015325, partial [Kipferlia bialata]|eukprot:g15325.t1